MPKHIQGYLSEATVAEMLDLSIWGLRGWRRRGYGPPSVKFGRSVFYSNEAVADFIAAPTKEGGGS